MTAVNLNYVANLLVTNPGYELCHANGVIEYGWYDVDGVGIGRTKAAAIYNAGQDSLDAIIYKYLVNGQLFASVYRLSRQGNGWVPRERWSMIDGQMVRDREREKLSLMDPANR